MIGTVGRITQDINVPRDELERWARFIMIPGNVLPRMGDIILMQLYISNIISHVVDYCVFDVSHQIRSCEGLERSRMKPATKFKRGILAGLWHKHTRVVGSASMIRNIEDQSGPEGRRILDIIEQYPVADGSIEDAAAAIAHSIVGLYEERSEKRRLTGEWIVFDKKEGTNYYHCLATHKQPQQAIMAMVATSRTRFPALIEPVR